MWKYAVQIAYDGTKYWGWQKQPVISKKNPVGLQTVLEAALEQMTGETPSVVGSGRTDSGVHAVGQVAHFVLKKKEWKKEILQRGLNGILPPEIRVISVYSVPLDFHAQRSAQKKQYSYYFQQGTCPLPQLSPFTWWIKKPLQIEKMNRALRTLIGTHDFKPFQASGAKPGPTVRTILEAEVSLQPIPFPAFFATSLEVQSDSPFYLVRVRVLGTGFLKQMVRGIAGTLLQVGEERRPASCMKEILASQDRAEVGPTAPARALWLEKVWY